MNLAFIQIPLRPDKPVDPMVTHQKLPFQKSYTSRSIGSEKVNHLPTRRLHVVVLENKLSRLRKKAAKRFFKQYKSLRVKEFKLSHLKNVVTIHPCADEKSLLKKIGCTPESCVVVDGYHFYKHQVSFFKICSPEHWPQITTTAQISYNFSWEKYRSIKWKLHEFTVLTDVLPITMAHLKTVVKYIENWIDSGCPEVLSNTKIIESKP